MMTIRTAEKKDAGAILRLLGQVLELHAAIRPDVFLPGTTKYTPEELNEIFHNGNRRSYVAEEADGTVVGYALCILEKQPFSNTMIPFTSLFIDDFCVDAAARGRGVGRQLFEHVKAEAKKLGCYEVTLNVWEGNDGAKAFYDRMGMRPKETRMELILN